MKTTLKVWTGLGLATALVGAGCSDETANEAETVPAAETGEAGEGGESGEGGVEIATAGTDPVVYGTALAIVEAHVIAARDAYALGKTDAAAEMFAHPVSEVLIDMDPVFEERGVADFKPLLVAASTGALAGESTEQINGHHDGIIAALRGAADKGPDSGAPEADVLASIVADMIGRAVAMHGEAASSERYEPYLDGYGFYRTGVTAFAASKDAIKAVNEPLHERITKALDLLAAAYPSAERPDALKANQGELSAASSSVQLSLLPAQ